MPRPYRTSDGRFQSKVNHRRSVAMQKYWRGVRRRQKEGAVWDTEFANGRRRRIGPLDAIVSLSMTKLHRRASAYVLLGHVRRGKLKVDWSTKTTPLPKNRKGARTVWHILRTAAYSALEYYRKTPFPLSTTLYGAVIWDGPKTTRQQKKS